MATHKIDWVDVKSPDWKVVTVKGENGNVDASVNRVDKSGLAFPGFDDIRPEGTVEGELWQSPAGKWYLFAPKGTTTTGNGSNLPQDVSLTNPTTQTSSYAKAPRGGAYKAKLIDDAMVKKEASITRFQASKEESIKMAGAQRDAVIIVAALMSDTGEKWGEEIVRSKIIEWRDWFLSEKFNETLPF